ncbi:hypothetical protein ACFE04_021692 [Oxalis oulophora]
MPITCCWHIKPGVEKRASIMPKIMRLVSLVVHDTPASKRSQETSPEDEGPAQKKAKIYDLATTVEVIFVVVVKAPRRKLRRPTMTGQFRSVGSSLVNSRVGMTVEKEIVSSSSPDEVQTNLLETSIKVVVAMAIKMHPEPADDDAEVRACSSSGAEEMLTVVATQAQTTPNAEEVRVSSTCEVGSTLKKANLLCQRLLVLVSTFCRF